MIKSTFRWICCLDYYGATVGTGVGVALGSDSGVGVGVGVTSGVGVGSIVGSGVGVGVACGLSLNVPGVVFVSVVGAVDFSV